MNFQENVWYVAALPGQLGRTLLRRVILGKPVLLYRRTSGEIAAIADRCPHRFAPLSRGTLMGDAVQCKYHGLRFSPEGLCTLNPHGKAISPHMRVHSYPVIERHGLVWLWPGDPNLADAMKVPDLSHMGSGPASRTVHSYLRADYRYDILVDNLLDLSHAEYLHEGSFSGGPPASSKTSAHEEHDEVIVERTSFDSPPAPFYAHVAARVDMLFRIRWRPGQIMSFDNWITPSGQPFEQGRHVQFAHIVTPESPNSTHYFMSITRDHDLDDARVDAALSQRQLNVIRTEDGPMLIAIDQEMGGAELTDLHPVLLATDAGAMRVRRVMERLIKSERLRPPVPTTGEPPS
jgi:phenylpropionate dioxygenase-like ring-hydroxylating dioxygenase large terminal subunit